MDGRVNERSVGAVSESERSEECSLTDELSVHPLSTVHSPSVHPATLSTSLIHPIHAQRLQI